MPGKDTFYIPCRKVDKVITPKRSTLVNLRLSGKVGFNVLLLRKFVFTVIIPENVVLTVVILFIVVLPKGSALKKPCLMLTRSSLQ